LNPEHCLVEREGHVLTVTLNRPEAKNALSGGMLAGMYRAWRLLDEDPELRVAILTGRGDVFCAGADLKAMGGGERDEEFQKLMAEVPDLHWQALLRHNRPMKPIIAAVEGYAVAGGTEILQGTDIRVAAEDAIFGVTEARRGLFPLGGSSVRLRRQIPYTLAAEILLTGRHVTAQEALAFGLVGLRQRPRLDPRAHAHAARDRRELQRDRCPGEGARVRRPGLRLAGRQRRAQSLRREAQARVYGPVTRRDPP
jgi:enoyl-CoA hydratase